MNPALKHGQLSSLLAGFISNGNGVRVYSRAGENIYLAIMFSLVTDR